MSKKIINKNQPCKKCGSSDAVQIYEDLKSYCFSCLTPFPANKDYEDMSDFAVVKTNKQAFNLDVSKFPSSALKDRKISKEVCEFFGVKVAFNENGEVDTHYYPYGKDGAYKVRALPKTFTWIKKSPELFGMCKFNGGGKRLIITEGEIDAMSVAQASFSKYSKIYPVVSLPSASMTKAILENRDWIRSFGEVVLCLDHDEAGDKATKEAIKIIGFDKVKLVKLPLKDANAVLVEKSSQELMTAIFEATKYIPAGILRKEQLWDAMINYNSIPSVPYPECLRGVNEKTKGMRPSEIALFISGTGSGKSSLLREIILHLIRTTNSKIGIVSLEESPAETTRKLCGLAIDRNPAVEELTMEEMKAGYAEVFESDRILVLDHQGSMSDTSIVEKLEFMALSGCEYLFIDHITILVSEGVDGLTGNEAVDKTMNDLLRLCQRHPVWIGLVSHLRKAPTGGKSFEEGKLPSIDDIRGSGSIKQVSFDIISFARDSTAETEADRNHIKMRVLKSRYTGLTGVVKGANYIYQTGRLMPSEADPSEEFFAI
jgi:twinkle protein